MITLQVTSNTNWCFNYSSYVLRESKKQNKLYTEVETAILKSYRATYQHDYSGGWLIFEDDELATVFLLRFS